MSGCCPSLSQALPRAENEALYYYYNFLRVYFHFLYMFTRGLRGHNRGVSPPQILSFLIKSIMKLAGLLISIFIYCSPMIVNRGERVG